VQQLLRVVQKFLASIIHATFPGWMFLEICFLLSFLSLVLWVQVVQLCMLFVSIVYIVRIVY
jgi:hypothetical protein